MAKELTTAEILERARQLMNDNGRHWYQGDYTGKRDGETCYCALGAIYKVCRVDPDSTPSTDPRFLRAFAAVRELERTISRVTRNRFAYTALWNDHPRRTWEQVDKMFRKAIKHAESVEA